MATSQRNHRPDGKRFPRLGSVRPSSARLGTSRLKEPGRVLTRIVRSANCNTAGLSWALLGKDLFSSCVTDHVAPEISCA